MKAIARVEVAQNSETGKAEFRVITLREPDPVAVESARAHARELFAKQQEKEARHERIRSGLMDLYNLDPDRTKLTYDTGLLRRRESGVDDLSRGALLTDIDVTSADGARTSFVNFVDHKTRIDSTLAADLGYEAELAASQGDYFSDVVTSESDAYYEAARTQTELYRSAQVVRHAGAAALVEPPVEQPMAEVIELHRIPVEVAS